MAMTYTKEELDFLEKEFGLSEKDLAEISEDDLLDIGDQCFEIETEEVLAASGGELSERGETAAALVTKINN